MASIVTRSGKGSPLTNAEVDANFTNLNTDKIETIPTSTGSTLGGIKIGSGLAIDGSGVVTVTSSGGIASLAADSSPQLGGALDVNGQDIVSTSNGSIELDPHGSGKVVFKGNATKGSGQLVLNCEQNSHGITIKGPPHSANAGYTLTLPNTDGSANQVLKTDGSGNLDWVAASSGGGADLYAANESSPTAQPSASNNNSVAIGDTAVAASNNAFAIGTEAEARSTGAIAIGFGAYAATSSFPTAIGYDSISTGAQSVALTQSNASGSKSFAAAIGNYSSSYGASGDNSVSIGYQCKASSTYSTSIGSANNVTAYGGFGAGDANTVSGDYGVAIGRGNTSGATVSSRPNVALGYTNVATGGLALALGGNSDTKNIWGKVAHAAGRFAANGDAQSGQFTLRADTTDATAEAMRTNNLTAAATNQVVAASDTCITFSGTIVAMQNGAQSYGSWEIKGLLVNDGGTTTLANSAITVISNTSNWGLALSADNTNNALAVTVTGEASHNIRWVANIQTSEVTFA